jgi:hypothetical protein
MTTVLVLSVLWLIVVVPMIVRRGDAPRRASTSSRRRQPVAAQEAQMHPLDRTEMSAARASMMKRRRRSLGLLIGGSVVFAALATLAGGMFWAAAAVFVLALGGYLSFLRGQARRDHERQVTRMDRVQHRTHRGLDVVEPIDRFVEPPASVVRIDDDDLELHNLDTIDLTGLYAAEAAEGDEELLVVRRAS